MRFYELLRREGWKVNHKRIHRLCRFPGLQLRIRRKTKSRAMDSWAYQNNVRLDFIRPGKPVENAFIESFNGKLRDECPNTNVFFSIEDARQKIEAWRIGYNAVQLAG